MFILVALFPPPVEESHFTLKKTNNYFLKIKTILYEENYFWSIPFRIPVCLQ